MILRWHGVRCGTQPNTGTRTLTVTLIFSLYCVAPLAHHIINYTSATPCFDWCYIRTLSSREDRHVVHGAKKKKCWVVVGGGVALGLASAIKKSLAERSFPLNASTMRTEEGAFPKLSACAVTFFAHCKSTHCRNYAWRQFLPCIDWLACHILLHSAPCCSRTKAMMPASVLSTCSGTCVQVCLPSFLLGSRHMKHENYWPWVQLMVVIILLYVD